MGRYLNSSTPYALYQGEANQPYFVDKSLLLTELFPVLDAGISMFVSQDQDVLEKRSWLI